MPTHAQPEPLVTVGIPVRTGGMLLERAVRSVLEQTHSNLQVVIGDNATDPVTARRLAALALQDRRVTILRSEAPITAIRNFSRLFEAARGEYFCWAADDDLRAPNYVATLVGALEANPDASLAFSDLALIDASGALDRARPQPHDFETTGLSVEHSLEKQAFCPPYHVYGLIRTNALRGYPWYEPDMAADWPLIAWLAVRGSFVYRPGTTFYYQDAPKTELQKSRANSLRGLRPFQGVRMAWACADSAVRAARPGRSLGRSQLLVRYYLWHGRGLKHLLLWRSPAVLRQAWWWLRRRRKPGQQSG